MTLFITSNILVQCKIIWIFKALTFVKILDWKPGYDVYKAFLRSTFLNKTDPQLSEHLEK